MPLGVLITALQPVWTLVPRRKALLTNSLFRRVQSSLLFQLTTCEARPVRPVYLTCRLLPLHPGKCEGPATVLVVLEIELDSVSQIARLPAEKLSALKCLISSWLPHKTCNRRDLESLIGHLHHAAKVVWPGRTFLRRMIDLLCCFRKKDHPIRLVSLGFGVTSSCTSGMVLASGFSQACSLGPMWKSLQMLQDRRLGYGAFLKGYWFAGSWASSQRQQSIAYKELFPVVIAAHVWGHRCNDSWLYSILGLPLKKHDLIG